MLLAMGLSTAVMAGGPSNSNPATRDDNSNSLLAGNSSSGVNMIDNTNSVDNALSYHHGGGGGGSKTFSIGGDLQFNKYFSGGPSIMGISALGELSIGKFAYRLGFAYAFPSKESFATYADAYSSLTNPQQVSVTETDKLSIINIYLDAKKVFASDYTDGGFYLYFGVNLSLISVSSSFSSYDQSNYYTTGGASGSLSQWYIRGGAGYDLKLGPGMAFAELGLDIAANSVNGVGVDVNVPSFFQIAAGYRVLLNK